MDWIITGRWVLGGIIAFLGISLLAVHLWIFTRAVILRKPTPSAAPLINLPICALGFGLLPIPNGFIIGVVIGCADVGFGSWANAVRP